MKTQSYLFIGGTLNGKRKEIDREKSEIKVFIRSSSRQPAVFMEGVDQLTLEHLGHYETYKRTTLKSDDWNIEVMALVGDTTPPLKHVIDTYYNLE